MVEQLTASGFNVNSSLWTPHTMFYDWMDVLNTLMYQDNRSGIVMNRLFGQNTIFDSFHNVANAMFEGDRLFHENRVITT